MILDEELEHYLNTYYIRRDEFEQRWKEKANDLHIFVDGHDRYLREAERRIDLQLQALEIQTAKLSTASEAFSQIMRYQADVNEQTQDALVRHEERMAQIDQSQVRLQRDVAGIFDALYGNSAHPDAPESIASMIKNGFRQAEEQRLTLMAKNESNEERLKAIEIKLDRWQSVITFAQRHGKTVFETVLRTAIGKVAFGVFSVFLAVRAALPEEMDRLGWIITWILEGKQP